MGTWVGTAKLLRRYPVKSMQPGVSESLFVGHRGVNADRRYVVVNTTGVVLTAKQSGGLKLLDCTAWQEQVRGQDVVFFLMPNQPGWAFRCGDVHATRALSELLNQSVEILAVAELQRRMPTNAGFSLAAGVGYDQSPVHLITTASLEAAAELYPNPGAFDVARLRPNLVIQTPKWVTGFVEDEWEGRLLTFPSGLTLQVEERTGRCVLPTRPQPRLGLAADGGMLRTLKTQHQGSLGVYATIVENRHGVMELGDEVVLN